MFRIFPVDHRYEGDAGGVPPVVAAPATVADPASANIAGVVQETLRLQAEAIGAESLLRKDRIAIFQ